MEKQLKEKQEKSLLEELKEIVESEDCSISEDTEIDVIRELKKQISTDDIKLAVLYVKCYTFLDMNSYRFINQEEDKVEEIKKLLKNYEIEEVRSLINYYGGGKEYGDYGLEMEIKNIVDKKREKLNELIKSFFQIMGEED